MTDNLIMFPTKSEPGPTGYFKCAECKNETFMLITNDIHMSLHCSSCGAVAGKVNMSEFMEPKK